MRRLPVLIAAAFALVAFVLWMCGGVSATPPRYEQPPPADPSRVVAPPLRGASGFREAVAQTEMAEASIESAPPMSNVVGRVIGRNGQPCVGVTVTGVHSDDGGASPMGSFEVVSSTGGYLEIGEAVFAGEWQVRVGDPWMLAEPENGQVSVGEGMSEIVIVVDAPVVGVSGLVVDEHGAAIEGVVVTGPGSFSVSELPRGRWTVMLASRELWGQTRVLGEVEVDSAFASCSFDIALLGASRVRGRVRVGDEFLREGKVVLVPEGLVIPQAMGISFRPSGSRESIEEFGNEVSCKNGRFDMDVQAGTYRAKVGVPRMERGGWDWFDCAGVLQVPPGQCALDLHVPLTTLAVEVRGVAGDAETITGKLIGKGFERSFGVEGANPVPISGVPAGPYVVIVRAGDLVRSVPVDVSAATATVVVDLR